MAPSLQFMIRPVPPFRLDLTAWALRRRARNAVDRWDGAFYRRVVVLNGRAMQMSARQTGTADAACLDVTVEPAPRDEAEIGHIHRLLDRVLGLQLDLSSWYDTVRRDQKLLALADRFRGVKPPRFPTIFEALVNAFACQQLSLESGLALLNRLATVCGTSLETSAGMAYAFPSADQIAELPPEQLRTIGFSHQKARAMIELATATSGRGLNLEALAREDEDAIAETLCELRGVGRWTAEYALLRGFGRLQVFPGDDVGAQKKLARWLGCSTPLDYPGVAAAVAPWHPYAGLVYFHLLLDGLSLAGELDGAAG
jgi:DNA-3-methyladenine glycosylase II